MATLSLTLPDDLTDRLAKRAKESGFSSIEDFAKALLEAEADEELEIDQDLEELLLRRMQSGPSVEFTPDFVDQLKADVPSRRDRAKPK